MIPIIPPVNALSPLTQVKRLLEGVVRNVTINSGASFCQVARRMHIGHGRLDITEGNQKCIGVAPSFVRIPRSKMVIDLGEAGIDSGV